MDHQARTSARLVPDYSALAGRVSVPNPELHERFAFHPANDDAHRAQHETVRANCEWLAQLLDELLPPSREASLAQTAVQDACQWANAALAIHGRDDG